MDNINFKSEKFKNDLYLLINNSGLPIANIHYILQIVSKEIENLYYDTLNKMLKQEQEKALQDKEKEEEQIEENA